MKAEEELKRFLRLECLFVWAVTIGEVMKEDGLNTDLWKTGGDLT
jgi:hypothetical protein